MKREIPYAIALLILAIPVALAANWLWFHLGIYACSPLAHWARAC